MNSVLIQSPASVTGVELRPILLEALGGGYDVESDTYHDSQTVSIPEAGTAPGTSSKSGKQIVQCLYAGTQAEIESALQNASLQQHQVVGFQTFADEYQGDNGDPIYAPTVTTAVEQGTLQYLNKRYSDEAQTVEIPPAVNWFPKYQGQAEWFSA